MYIKLLIAQGIVWVKDFAKWIESEKMLKTSLIKVMKAFKGIHQRFLHFFLSGYSQEISSGNHPQSVLKQHIS